MLIFRSAALSDVGRVRSENEDRFLHDEAAGFYGVADGVGGLPGGAEAAQLAIDELAAALRAVPAGQEADLPAAFRTLNESVRLLGQRMNPQTGIATTLTAGLVRAEVLRIGHVGDSRAYLSRKGLLKRITEDHSVENEVRRRRAMGELVSYRESQRNALTRCIGQPTPLEVDVFSETLAAGDRVLFCTDGITRLVPDRELGEMLAAAASPQAVVESLVQLAVRRGGPDNATAVALFADAG
jgi:serine/threonine protein phosphatase PrpC